jgi:protein O-GlcNAc transferase
MFDIWMRLLSAVGGSVLWLVGGNNAAENVAAENNLKREAAARGIAPQRLVFAPRANYAEYLARYRLADLFLDTLPFNAGTTASDALWMGLPVLTCAGKAFSGRVAGSMLNAIGLPELVADSTAAYEALALKLATQPEILGAIRTKLAHNCMTTPLFNVERTCRHVESAYKTMMGIWHKGEPPRSFAVTPID